jgi:GT2 family glycosyltransferase
MKPQISIIILNYNGWKDTIECLESVFFSSYTNYQVIVVDNFSEDESLQKIKDYCSGKIQPQSPFFKYNPNNKPIPICEFNNFNCQENYHELIGDNFSQCKRLIIIKNEKNYGFTEGNNIAIRFIRENFQSKYIFLLNNDTVIHPECIGDIIALAEKEERIGIVGALPYRYTNPKDPESKSLIFNPRRGNFKQIFIHDENFIDVDYVSGCSLLIADELISKIGLLYSPLYLYYEDTDWCLRAKSNGYRIITKIAPRVWHKGGSSINKSVMGSHLKMYFGTRNRIICTYRNSNSLDFLIFCLYFIIFVNTKTHIDTIKNRKVDILLPFYRALLDSFRFICTIKKEDGFGVITPQPSHGDMYFQ